MELGFHVRGCRNDTNISLLIAVLFEPFIFHSEIPPSVHVTRDTTTYQPCAALSHCTRDVSFSHSTYRNSANRYREFIFRKRNFWCADLRTETRCITLNYLFSINTFNRHEKYRVIKKFMCTWWLQYRKLQVMFKAPPPPKKKSPQDIHWHAELCSRRPCSV